MAVRNLLGLSGALKNPGIHTSFTIHIILNFDGLGWRKNSKALCYTVTVIPGKYRGNKYCKGCGDTGTGIFGKKNQRLNLITINWRVADLYGSLRRASSPIVSRQTVLKLRSGSMYKGGRIAKEINP